MPESTITVRDLTRGGGVQVVSVGVSGPQGPGAGALLAANNLSDVPDKPTARTNLGAEAAGAYRPGGTDVPVVDGGTGASSASAARSNLGLSNVDNTSDANKPVSTAQQTALDGTLKRRLSSTSSPFGNSGLVRLSNAFTCVCIGIDEIDGRIFGRDTSNASVKQSSDWGGAWSVSKTTPTDVTAANLARIVRFGSFLYALGRATTGGLTSVYRTAPASGNNLFSWSGILKSFTSGGTALATSLEASNWGTGTEYLFAAEYGDPVGGPSIYRSADGLTWEQVVGPLASTRHIHAVKADPFNPGHVWATLGDGTPFTIMRSVDSGATWTTAVSSAVWQGVQISFTQEWVVIAGDSLRGTVLVVDRATNTPYMASRNFHQHLPVPGVKNLSSRRVTDAVLTSGSTTLTSASAAFTSSDLGRFVVGSSRLPYGTYITAVSNSTTVTLSQAALSASAAEAVTFSEDMYLGNAYYGAVDPATGHYYCVANDAAASGQVQGMFLLPEFGGRLEVLEPGGVSVNMNGMVFVANGYVFSGMWRRPLVSLVVPS